MVLLGTSGHCNHITRSIAMEHLIFKETQIPFLEAMIAICPFMQ